VIPDLDEDGADADQRVAHAPRNFNRKVPTLDELEHDVKSTVSYFVNILHKHLFLSLHNILLHKAALPTNDTGLDMTVLFRTLVPVAQVQENDVPWSFDSLLRVRRLCFFAKFLVTQTNF
jgi:Intraflagellar transport protein 43